MGLWNWIRTQALGVDLDETQATLDRTDAQLAIENQKDYGPGGTIYNRTVQEKGVDAANQQYEEVNQRLMESHIDVESEVGQAFDEGLQEGYDNITGGIKKTLKAPFQFAWASIPWQVWLLGAVLLFVYVGGVPWALRMLKARLK